MGSHSRNVKNVLIVDDDAGFLETLREGVQGDGSAFRVLTANSGREALELLEREPVDLVMTDVKMPGMDGCEFINRLRETRPGLPVLVMSSHIGAQAESRFEGLSVLGFIEKSLALGQVAALVSGALGELEAAGGVE